MQPVAGMRAPQGAELAGEDHPVGAALAVHVNDVTQRSPRGEAAQHAHDRRDAAPGADEEQLYGDGIGKAEGPFHPAQSDDGSRPRAAQQIRRDPSAVDELGRDRDAPVGPARVRGQRVGAPVMDAVDVDSQAHVLPGPVPRPLPSGLDQHGGGGRGVALDALDAPAQLARAPQGVDQLEVVVGAQRVREGAQQREGAAPCKGNCRRCAALSHGGCLRWSSPLSS